MKHRLLGSGWVFLLALAFAVIVAGCSSDNSTPASTGNAEQRASSSFPVSITDTSGKTVKLESAPRRIVALSPSFVEILYAIGAGDSVAAVDENTDFPAEALSKPKVSGFKPSIEGIASHNPDLVLISYDPGGVRDSLERLGVKVLHLDAPESIQAVFGQIHDLGRASGRDASASRLIAETQAKMDGILSKLTNVTQGPTVFHELDNTYFTVGPGSFVADLYAKLKARNIAQSTAKPYPQMTAEAIVKADPQVIVLADEDAGESPRTVAARPGWQQISAVKNSRIHTVDPDIVSRPGPRLSDALTLLAKALYPDRFP